MCSDFIFHLFKKFYDFPFKLYKYNSFWIPPFWKELKDFFKKTKLNLLRPGCTINVTETGRYEQIIQSINSLEKFEKDHENLFNEKVLYWYDKVYLPIVKIIQSEKLLSRFPGRTEADLYIWIEKYYDDLKREYGENWSLKKAVKMFNEKYGKKFTRLKFKIIKEFLKKIFRITSLETKTVTTNSMRGLKEQKKLYLEERKFKISSELTI